MFEDKQDCDKNFFKIAYGVYVAKLLRDAPNAEPSLINEKLEQIGINMGKRLIYSYLSLSMTSREQY